MRCYGCSQENCEYSGPCYCSCHRGGEGGLYEDPRVPIPPRAKKPAKCPCSKHRSYKAVRAPTTGCEACWRFFVKMNP